MIVAGHLNENVSFIFSLKVVAVDNANRIVKLQTVTEAQTGTRVQAQHPAVLDHNADTGRNKDGLMRNKRKAFRRKKIIAGRALGRAARQPDVLIDLLGLIRAAAGSRAPVTDKLFLGYLEKLCDLLHNSELLFTYRHAGRYC